MIPFMLKRLMGRFCSSLMRTIENLFELDGFSLFTHARYLPKAEKEFPRVLIYLADFAVIYALITF